METQSICGLCLERLKYQIKNAKKRAMDSGSNSGCGRIMLECYNTADPDEIVDILEIYHAKDRTLQGVKETLSELAYSASVLTREPLQFDFSEEGHLGLFLLLDATVAN
ncbi:MAG: hypothetical protein HQL08_00405 [Nitrospirae bacterium]|nr:hypothetical protein [Nitrospirota bacterium]